MEPRVNMIKRRNHCRSLTLSEERLRNTPPTTTTPDLLTPGLHTPGHTMWHIRVQCLCPGEVKDSSGCSPPPPLPQPPGFLFCCFISSVWELHQQRGVQNKQNQPSESKESRSGSSAGPWHGRELPPLFSVLLSLRGGHYTGTGLLIGER